MIRLKLIVLLLITITSGAAQEFKLGGVTKQELQEKVHPADTSAPAAVLYKKGRTYFEVVGNDWRVVTEVDMRVKIYKAEGYEYANEEVSYYSGSKTMGKVYFENAYTYNLTGDKIEKTKLKSDGEFDEKLNETTSVKKIVMPNVREGSVVEYRYVFKTPYIFELQDWYFQHAVPVNNVTYEVSIPAYYSYNTHLSGYVPVKQTPARSSSSGGFGFNETVVEYSAKNVKAMKSESYVNNIRNYMSILKHELSSYTPTNGATKYFSTTWEKMSETIYKSDDFGKELEYKSYFEKDIDALLPAGASRDQKIAIIFNYVQTRMKWNEKFGYTTISGVKKAYQEKTGNVADINLMLTAMLRHAGLSTNPVLVSTRKNGITIFPTLSAYNYVIAAVEIENDLILLDATSKYTLPNVLPVRALNWMGRIIRKTGSTAEVNLLPRKRSREVINIVAEVDMEGKVSGKATDQYFDYYALAFRDAYTGINKDSYIELMEKEYKGITVNDHKLQNEKDITAPVIEEYSFSHSGLTDVIGNKIYIDPLLYFTETENPFKEPTREYAIDYVFPKQDKYIITIKIPEGYAVESLPKALSLAMEQGIGTFKFNTVSQNNQIQIAATLDINFASVSAEYYGTIKDFFTKMIDKQNEKIVLKKI